MDRIFFFLGDIAHTKLGGGDTFSDQLNCKYTVYVLSLFAILVTTKVYVGEPISCWCPANFPGSQVDYTDKYCWATNTHYVPISRDLPKELEKKSYISYYQWIPLFLSLQAILFYVPRPLWRSLSRKSGLAIYNITDTAIQCQRQADQSESNKSMLYMANYMIRYLKEVRRRRDVPSILRPFRHIYYTCYLTGAFVFIKLLYAVNAIGQLFLVNIFLGTDFHLYGVDVVRRMATGVDWTTSHRFPRVTICDFQIRVLGNVHRHTVQCALPMNLYNEMMFIFLWFWFVLVSAFAVSSLAYWIAVVTGIGQQINFVRLRLGALGKFDVWGAQTGNINRPRSFVVDGGDGIELVHQRPLPSVSVQPPTDDLFCAESGRAAAAGEKRGGRIDLARFVESYLTRDGCLILRLVAENSSDMIAAELLGYLYDHYVKCGNGRPMPSNRSWLQMQAPSVSVTDTSRVCGSGDATLDKNDNPTSTFSTVGSVPSPPSVRCSPTAPRHRPSPSLSRHSADMSDAAMTAGCK